MIYTIWGVAFEEGRFKLSAQKTNVHASQGEMPFKNSETDCDAKNKYNACTSTWTAVRNGVEARDSC